MTRLDDAFEIPSRIGSPAQVRWLNWVVRVLLVLNLLDATFTLFWVNAGLAKEANPLLNGLVVQHPVLFVVVKIGLVSMGSWLLWAHRDKALAVVSIFVAFLVYYAVLVYHIDYLTTFIHAMMAS